LIEVKNLTKRYGGFTALDDVSFNAGDCEVLGFLGPNGAGKTTAMNIITGYISASDGFAVADGVDILEKPLQAKRGIGYLPEQPPLYQDMTVAEYLDFVYGLKKTRIAKKEHIGEVCEKVKITDMSDRLIRNLSKGYKQRTGLAAALIGNPRNLILDEPTVGLDPKQIIDIRELIKELGKEHTVIFSSHILSEVQEVSDRLVIINKGKVVSEGKPDELIERLSANIIVRAEHPDPDKLRGILQGVSLAESVSEATPKTGNVYEFVVEAKKGADCEYELPRRIGEALYKNGAGVIKLNSGSRTLEEVFLTLVK